MFEHSAHAVLAIDAAPRSRIAFLNAAAAALFNCTGRSAVGRYCWGVARLTAVDGTPLCRADCPLLTDAKAGHAHPVRRVSRRAGRGPASELELMTFPIPGPSGGIKGVLHILTPGATPLSGAARPPAGTRCLSRGLQRLTAREREVLRALSSGRATEEVASLLGIRECTVRNHVHGILAKLGAHRRIEAVVALLGEDTPDPRPPG
jgi:DNA-binding CsgD family transcriptional regulator